VNVTLINYTYEAAELLIFTKQTRLTLSPGLFDEIRAWPHERKRQELQYMAQTIPSSWEFCDYTFLIEGVSRAYTHQQVRTRIASYAQQTMRVNNMAEFEYVYTDRNREDERAMDRIKRLLTQIRLCYTELVGLGQPEEDARGILPTNIATNIICKFNLRTFCDLAKSRMGGRTQKEYQKVINAMVNAVQNVHPWVDLFLFANHDRNYFDELEAFALREFPDLKKRGELLKIIDAMRKG
jgi:flavin-dependent thymidylate synthase